MYVGTVVVELPHRTPVVGWIARGIVIIYWLLVRAAGCFVLKSRAIGLTLHIGILVL